MSAPAARSPPVLPREGGTPPPERPPFLLDFYPLEESNQTGLSRFYDGLREGRLTTTRCPADGTVAWPPRTVCPKCHHGNLEWIDLPRSGTLYAFSAVLAGAPLGMEADVPFAVGLVDLDGVPVRLFGRLAGRPWTDLAIGDRVVFEPFDLPDGRVFYRFRTAP
ncbi:MAG TPA: Zn-ribbon domain-containing OB-fold protein [Thermoplasmata archaeon]|nr:Zn-ribbon domain-containing OB-fold protein [Thermoplasmata archaeon]